MRRFFGTTKHVVIFFLLLFVSISNLYSGVYNANDSTKLANFFNSVSTITGQVIGKMLNPNYDLNNPFAGMTNIISWTNDITNKRVTEIIIPGDISLSGELNVTNFTELTFLQTNNNALGELSLSGCSKLTSLICSNNNLTRLMLTGCNSLTLLNCENNSISQMDLRDCQSLISITATNNNLSFAGGLLLPTNVSLKPGWNFGLQKLYIPNNVKLNQKNEYVSTGVTIDLTGMPASTYNWFYDDNTVVEADSIIINNSIFTFKSLLKQNIYCVIKNTTEYGNLEVKTVKFKLQYTYNSNDVMRLRTFLEQASVDPNKKNGEQVNSLYNATDPSTFMVEWIPITTNMFTELRLSKIINWDSSHLNGNFNLVGTDYLTHIIIKHNAITGFEFSNTTGIEVFDCSNNNIKELNLACHTKLLTLICNTNRLMEVDVRANSLLNYLSCHTNSVKEIKFANNQYLRELDCSNNILSAIYLNEIENIERLYCNKNNITDLDVLNLTKLNILEADNNLLKSLDLHKCLDMQRVSLRKNNLSSLDMTELNKINYLQCDSNKLNFATLLIPLYDTSITKLILHPQDTVGREEFNKMNDNYVSKNMTINLNKYTSKFTGDKTYFNWKSANGIIINKTLDTTGVFIIPPAYEDSLIHCEITCQNRYYKLVLITPSFIARTKYNENDTLRLRTFLDLYSKFGTSQNGLTNGKVINPNYNSADPATFPVVWTVVAGEKRVQSIDWYNASKIKGNLDLSGCTALEMLNVSCDGNLQRNAVSALKLDDCVNLKWFKARYNQIALLTLTNCEKLDSLDCAYNVIENEVQIPNNYIVRIDIGNNKITNIKLDLLPKLTYLNVSNNKLNALNIEKDVELLELYCNNNNIGQLNLIDNSLIKKIDFSNNKISEISLTNLLSLQILYCNHNKLSELNVDNNIELVAIHCGNNNLSELDLSNVNYVTDLEAENNKLVFTTITYVSIPNELVLHPQADIRPDDLDNNNILINGTLNLYDYVERTGDNYITTYTLRYLDGTGVAQSLYSFSNGVFSNFDDILEDRTLYVSMTNNRYPGLTLKTVLFNTKLPTKYNENDVAKLQEIFNHYTADYSMSNGNYLTSSTGNSNYDINRPETFPVIWEPINGEYRVTHIAWEDKWNLNGTINLSECTYLDTLIITNISVPQNGGINNLIMVGCDNIKNIQITGFSIEDVDLLGELPMLNNINLSNNKLASFNMTNCKSVTTINVSNNQIATLNLNGLNYLTNLNVKNNKLIFNTCKLSVKPANFEWEPQAAVIPNDVTLKEDDTYYYTNNYMDFMDISNTPLQLQWFNAQTAEELNISSNNNLTTFNEACDLKTLYCVMTSNENMFEGFTLQTIPFFLDMHQSINDKQLQQVSIYPNPAKFNATLEINDEIHENLTINIHDITGNLINTIYQGIFINSINLQLDKLNNGTYYIHISTKNKTSIIPLNVNR